MDFNQIMQTITAIAIAFGLKIVGAIVVWVVGRYLIGLAVRLVSNALEKQRVDPTVLRYLGTVISVTLNIILVIAILGYFGVETTTFAALFAAAGVAIGLAWSGLLSNFAGGAFLIILRPIKVGDFVTAGGVTGTVREIGLFVTAINTPGQRLDDCRKRKDLLRYDSEFFRQPLPARRFESPAQSRRRSQPSDAAPKRAVGKNSQCQNGSRAGCRDSRFQSGGSGPGGASLLSHGSLLAGLL
jgi:small conductance mechanosensitive channel